MAQPAKDVKLLDLIQEFHYNDGDVGAYHILEIQPDIAEALSRLWADFSKSNNHNPTHIVIRPDTEDGQLTSNRLYASMVLQAACEKLVIAYQRGEANGAEMDWSDVDEAWEAAKEALAKIYGCKSEEVGNRVLPVPKDEEVD